MVQEHESGWQPGIHSSTVPSGETNEQVNKSLLLNTDDRA